MASRIVVVVGSLNADFVTKVERFPKVGETVVGHDLQVFPGGKGANQAYAAAKLGGQVTMIGRVGNDGHADWLRSNLASAGVDVSRVARDETVSSGTAFITIDRTGQNQIVVVPGANGDFSRKQLEENRKLIVTAKVVLLQLEIPLDIVTTAALWAKQSGATVILDPAPAQQIPDHLLRSADYLTPNETELAVLAGESPWAATPESATRLAHILLDRGAEHVLVKMGAQGALLIGHGQEHFWPAFPVQAVDTTAAGDAFNAAFAVGLAEGKSPLESGPFACAAAACSVTRLGAQPSMPTRSEVEAFLASREQLHRGTG